MSKRAPAQTVKCPHCDHTGSARGLFTHIRLAHPGIASKPPISRNEHPYAIGSSVAKALDKKAPKTQKQSVEEVLITTISMAVLKGINDWLEKTNVAQGVLALQTKGQLGQIPRTYREDELEAIDEPIQREAKKPPTPRK